MAKKLKSEEKKVLLKYKNKKVKSVQKTMKGIINPKTKKPLKYTTLNLSVNEQAIAVRLFNKGYLCCAEYMHKLRVSPKGLNALKKRSD